MTLPVGGGRGGGVAEEVAMAMLRCSSMRLLLERPCKTLCVLL